MTPGSIHRGLLSVLVAGTVVGCDGAEEEFTPTSIYRLALGTRVRQVQQFDLTLDEVKGGGNGEVVRVDLNGHPFVFRWTREFGVPINQYLMPPSVENHARVVSPRGLKGVLGVEAGPPLEQSVLVASDPATVSPPRIAFSVPDGINHHFEPISFENAASRENAVAAITDELRKLYRAIADGNSETAASMLCNHGYSHWAIKSYGGTNENVRGVRRNLKRFIDDHAEGLIEPDWSQLQLAIGDRSVLTYTAWDPDEEFMLSPYVFDVYEPDTPDSSVDSKREMAIWCIRFVRSDSGWVIWDYNRYGP